LIANGDFEKVRDVLEEQDMAIHNIMTVLGNNEDRQSQAHMGKLIEKLSRAPIFRKEIA